MASRVIKAASASKFFERRADYIRESLKSIDDEIAIREDVVALNERRGRLTDSATLRELSYWRNKRRELRGELQRALFNAGRK